jgi:hypothetical protein
MYEICRNRSRFREAYMLSYFALIQNGTANYKGKKTPWPESGIELYRPNRFLEKLVPTSADRGCHVVNVTDPYGRILGFLDRIQGTKYQRTHRAYVTQTGIWE